jgi:hypothetical protein
MKAFRSATVTVNAILLLFLAWLFWIGQAYLPGQLDANMERDVMLAEYQTVCARLTTYLAGSCFLLIVLVDIVLLRACLRLTTNGPCAEDTLPDTHPAAPKRA